MMLGSKAYRFVVCGAMALFGIAIAFFQPSARAQQPARAAPYTAEQANAGRATYQVKCASCHLPDLKGSNEAPPLSGINFTNMWGGRPANDLFNRIRNTMPITDPGSLTDEEAVNIVAYLLQANGAAAGTEALTPATMAPIGAVTGGPGSTPTLQPTRQTPTGRPPVPARASGAPAGLTFEGEVKNYVPVTDEMLLRPDPSDWLMVRGN
jgi:mono/diheme cytochrome c family protein